MEFIGALGVETPLVTVKKEEDRVMQLLQIRESICVLFVVLSAIMG